MSKMAENLFALSLGFAGLIWAAQNAQAQTARGAMQCGARAEVMAVLSGKYRETRRGLGMAGPSGVVELFASAESGTWTVTVTLPDGRTCLMASGAGWEVLNEELPARVNPT